MSDNCLVETLLGEFRSWQTPEGAKKWLSDEDTKTKLHDKGKLSHVNEAQSIASLPTLVTKGRHGILDLIEVEFGVNPGTRKSLRDSGIVGSRPGNASAISDYLAKLTVAGQLRRRHSWTDTKIREVFNRVCIDRPEFGFLKCEERSPRRGAASRLEAGTSLQQMIIHRVLRWLSGYLANEHVQELQRDGDEFTVMFRPTKPDERLAHRLEPAVLSRPELREWVNLRSPVAVCHVSGWARPYDVRIWPLGIVSADEGSRESVAVLYRIADSADRLWECLVLTDGAEGDSKTLSRATGPDGQPRAFRAEESNVLQGLLRFASDLVPGFGQMTGTAESGKGDDAADLYVNPLLNEYRRHSDRPLAHLAEQLNHVARAVRAMSPGFDRSLILLPREVQETGMPGSTIYGALCLVSADGWREDDLQVQMPHEPDKVSFSEEAYALQRTRIVSGHELERMVLQELEKATMVIAVPLGLGHHRGTNGVLYVSVSGEHKHKCAIDSVPALEIVANIIGDMIRAYRLQRNLLDESFHVVGTGEELDRLTRFSNREGMERYLNGTQFESVDCLPVILVHLAFPPGLSAEAISNGVQRVDDTIRRTFLSELRQVLDLILGSSIGERELYRAFVLDRKTYALVLQPPRELPTSSQEFAKVFYTAKTRLARAMRLVTLGGVTGDYHFSWVRAGVMQRFGQLHDPRIRKWDLTKFLESQGQLLEDVRTLRESISLGRYDEASERLRRLKRASPSGALHWGILDPAIVLEEGRLLTLRALGGPNPDQLLRTALKRFDQTLSECWTGTLSLEWGFAVKKLIELELADALDSAGTQRSAGDMLRDLKPRLLADVVKARRILMPASSPMDTRHLPAGATSREVLRLLVEIAELEQRIQRCDSLALLNRSGEAPPG